MEQKCRRDFAFVSIAETCRSNEAKIVFLQKGIPKITLCVVKTYTSPLANFSNDVTVNFPAIDQ